MPALASQSPREVPLGLTYAHSFTNTVITIGTLRLGMYEPSPLFDGVFAIWHHYSCVSTGSIHSFANVQGVASINPDDQERVRRLCLDYVDIS